MSLLGAIESQNVLVAPPASNYAWDNEYLFEEKEGSVISDYRGNYDATAKNSDDTANPAYEYNLNVAGKTGSGIHVYKATPVLFRPSNELVSAEDPNISVFLDAKCDYTPAGSYGQRVFIIHNSSSGNSLIFIGFESDTKVYLYVTGTKITYDIADPLTWNEIGFTYDGSVCTLYHNRVALGSISKSVASTTSEPAKICFSQGNTSFGFDGSVDNVRIVKAVLTQQEIDDM